MMRGSGSYAAATLLLAAVLLNLLKPTHANKNQFKFRVNKDSGNRCEHTNKHRVPVTNESVCRMFAGSGEHNISAVYRHSVTLPGAPPGCFIFEAFSAQLEPFNGIYFNHNTTGGSHQHHSMVCVLAGFPQGAPAPPPDQRSWADEVQFCEGPDNGRLAFQEAVPFNKYDACKIDAADRDAEERCTNSGWVMGPDAADGSAECQRPNGSSATLGAADCTGIVGGVWVDATCLDAATKLSSDAMLLPDAMGGLCSSDLGFQHAFELASTLCCAPEMALYRCGPPPPAPIRFCTGPQYGREHFIDANFPEMEVGDCIIPTGSAARCASAGFFADGNTTCDSSTGMTMTEAACPGIGGIWSPRDCRQMQTDLDYIVSTQPVCENPHFFQYLQHISIGCCVPGTAYTTYNDICRSTVAPAVTDPPDQNTGYLDAVYYPQGSDCTDSAAIVELQYTFRAGQTCIPFPDDTPLDWTVNTGDQTGLVAVAGTYLQISPCTHPASDEGAIDSVAVTGAVCDSACNSCLTTFERPLDAHHVRGLCTPDPFTPMIQQFLLTSYRPACPAIGAPTPAITPGPPPTVPVNPSAPQFCIGPNYGADNFNSATSLDIEDSCVINGTDPRQLAACNTHFRVDSATGACVYNGRVPMSAHSCEAIVGGTWVEKTCGSGADHAARLSEAALNGVCDDDALSLLFSTMSSVCCSPDTGYYRCGPPPPPPLRFCTGDNYGNDNFIDTNVPVESSVQCTIPNSINATRERAACVAAGFEVDHGTRCKHKDGRSNPDMSASACLQIGGIFTANDCQQELIELFSELSDNNAQICSRSRNNADYFTSISQDCCANGTTADAFQALCGGPNATVEPFTPPADGLTGYFAMDFFLESQCRGRPDVALIFSFAPGETCIKFPDNTPEAWTTVDGHFVVDSYMRISTCDAAGSIAIHAVFCTEGCSFCEYDYVQRRGSSIRLTEVAQTCQLPLVPGYPMFRFLQKRAACSRPNPVTTIPHITDGPGPNTVPGGMGRPQDHPDPPAATAVTETSIIAIVVGAVVVVVIAASVAFYYVRTKYGGNAQASYLNPNFGGEDPSAYLHPSEPQYEDDDDYDDDDVYEDDEDDEHLMQFE